MGSNPIQDAQEGDVTMIKFNFTVSDVDAQNIFDCVNSEIQKMYMNGLGHLVKISESEDTDKIKTLELELDWFNGHAVYLGELLKKMKKRLEIIKEALEIMEML